MKKLQSFELDKKNPLPLYHQLSQIFKSEINNGAWKVGEAIPPIPRLVKSYNVSQNTVRQAIAVLVEEELLYTDQGRGTFVQNKIPYSNKKNGTIAILTPDIEVIYLSASVMKGIEAESYMRGLNLFFCSTHNRPERFKKYVRSFVKKGVNGLILVPISINKNYEEINLKLLKLIERFSLPYILMDSYLDTYETNKVVTNNEEAGFILTEHLIKAGYQRIAFISTAYASSVRDRLNGYKRALAKYNIPYVEEFVVFKNNIENEIGYSVAKRLLNRKPKPDSFFAVNDGIALEAFRAIEEKGLRVPEDIGLVGFDDNYFASQMKVPLTTMRQPARKMGEKAMKLFLSNIGEKKKKPKTIVVNSTLIIRKSSVRT